MTDVAKGLNAKGGKNTHRFQTKADRVASVRVDVSRRIERTSGIGTNAGAVPDAGEHGSFFFDELERMRHLYATPQYMAFYREVHPRALTMALLLHHRRRDDVRIAAAELQLRVVQRLHGDRAPRRRGRRGLHRQQRLVRWR